MVDMAVDLEEMGRLATSLAEARDGLGGALGAMGDVGTALGTVDLDRACGEFQRSWATGLGKVGECVDAARAGVDRTRATYAEAEAAIANGFQAVRGRPAEVQS